MKIIVDSVVCFLVAVFPILLSTIYCIYEKSLERVERYLYLDISLIASEYLLLLTQNDEMILLLSIPILISILEKRDLSFFLCLILLFSLSNISIIECLIIIILYLINKHKNLNKYLVFTIFVLIKSLFFIIDNSIYQLNNLYILLLFLLLILLFMWSYNICKMATNLFMTLKDLEENKQVKEAIFKISHEIKNPLAVCKGYLDMYDSNNEIHTKKYVPIIKSEIEKTLVILQDFLNLSKTKLNLDILDVNLLIEECLNNIELLLKTNHINVNKELYDDDLYIVGDYNRLQQVLVNVIKNSVEAMVDSDTKDLFIKSIIDNKYILIQIDDTGCGIAKNIQKKIMEPFFTTKSNGTGLGVPFSIEVINAHNGNMEYIQLKTGTRVEIRLLKE